MGLFSNFAGGFVKERVTNTKTAFQLIVKDFKRYILILKWVFLLFSASTLIYSIVVRIGDLIINCALLGLLVIYSIVDTILRNRENPNPSKKVRKIYIILKLSLNAAALASSIYSLYSATAHQIKPISIVLTTLSIIMFVLKVLVEICFDIFSSKWELLKSGMALDAKEHPNTAGRLFSPIIGDVEEVDVKPAIEERIKNKQNQ